MERKTLLLMLVVGVLIAAGPVAATPLQSGETLQEWVFSDNSNPAIPEIDLNPYGTATATIAGGVSGPPPVWAAELLGRDGVWQADQMVDISLDIPNQMIPNPYKEIHLEIGFTGDLAAFSVFPIPFGGNVELVSQSIEVVDEVTGWKKLTAMYVVEPNPERESVCYSFSGDAAAVDYINVRTICVPEPLTISMLGLGGLMPARRRRRS